MRKTLTVTISLPPDLAEEVDRLAAEERRTRSELLREAFRQYVERRRRWERVFTTAEDAVTRQGLTDDAITAAVKSRRGRRRTDAA